MLCEAWRSKCSTLVARLVQSLQWLTMSSSHVHILKAAVAVVAVFKFSMRTSLLPPFARVGWALCGYHCWDAF
jgi:hypothetical protein